MTYNILIAEDDKDIVSLLKLYLESNFNVLSVENGFEAIEVFKNNKIDLAIFDVMMPGMTGFELTKYIRKISNIPIIIISACQLDSDKILGLDLGADDYLVKPFNPLELIARINVNLRRVNQLSANPSQATTKISEGDLVVDTRNLTLEKNGNPIVLTATEYKILVLLMQSPNRVYTKMHIYEEINGDYFTSDDNTIIVHVSNLRDKIEDEPKSPKYIKTVRGIGYKFEKQN